MSATFTITGKQVAIEELLQKLRNEQALANQSGIKITDERTVTGAKSLRKPLGLEPLVYFFVVYTAHLAGELTIETVRLILNKHKNESTYDIKIEERIEEPKEK